MRQARAQFSCNFLACAGYKVIDNLGFPTVEEGVEAAMKAGADIVVLCSSDDEYAEYAIPAFKAWTAVPCLSWPVLRSAWRLESRRYREFHPRPCRPTPDTERV